MIKPYSHYLHGAAVEEIYAACFPPPFTYDMLNTRIVDKKSKTFIATNNDLVVGYVITALKEGNPYLTQVGVHKDYRGAGIGTELIRAAESCYPSGSLMWLETEVNNPAQKLYFDLGYRVRGFCKNLYGVGKDGIAMYKILT